MLFNYKKEQSTEVCYHVGELENNMLSENRNSQRTMCEGDSCVGGDR